ncbi:hypothetical protein [Hyphobacterium sp.]|uniref:hypothetical protein n=1 Tax=Hyphobacterium sp. TaxID=2004662 RepID=UPI003BA89B5F
MSNIALKSLLSAAALAAISVGAAEARYDPGLCQLTVSNSRDGSGLMTATAAPGFSGFYELEAYQIRPTGTLDLSQAGPFRSRGWGPTLLSQASLSTSYAGAPAFGPERPRGVRIANEGWNDGVYGRDVSLQATLRVYDQSGRLVCSDTYRNLAPARSRFGY